MIGPAIGGALARPCKFYPSIFPAGSIWDKFPYLLPNLFSAAAVVIGVVVGILFLEETHPIQKYQRDPGLELGKRLLASLKFRKDASESGKTYPLDEEEPLIDSDDQLPGYRTTETSPRLKSVLARSDLPDALEPLDSPDANKRRAMRAASVSHSEANRSASKIFTKPIILNTISFGILAL